MPRKKRDTLPSLDTEALLKLYQWSSRGFRGFIITNYLQEGFIFWEVTLWNKRAKERMTLVYSDPELAYAIDCALRAALRKRWR